MGILWSRFFGKEELKLVIVGEARPCAARPGQAADRMMQAWMRRARRRCYTG